MNVCLSTDETVCLWCCGIQQKNWANSCCTQWPQNHYPEHQKPDTKQHNLFYPFLWNFRKGRTILYYRSRLLVAWGQVFIQRTEENPLCVEWGSSYISLSFVQTHKTIQLKYMHHILCKLYFSKVAFQKNAYPVSLQYELGVLI